MHGRVLTSTVRALQGQKCEVRIGLRGLAIKKAGAFVVVRTRWVRSASPCSACCAASADPTWSSLALQIKRKREGQWIEEDKSRTECTIE